MAVYTDNNILKVKKLNKFLLAQGNHYPNVSLVPIMYITLLHLKLYPTKINIPSPVSVFVKKI